MAETINKISDTKAEIVVPVRQERTIKEQEAIIANVESVVAYHQSELAKEEARLDEMIAKGVKTPEELEDLK